ncbi:hypothetical protein ID866_3687 [Astraeus odoratus]|nr:hypothetical protein ID866_3687 [Astraeus odoratus]
MDDNAFTSVNMINHMYHLVSTFDLKPSMTILTYCSLALSSLGYDVLATDTAHVCDSVLRRNVSANIDHLPAEGAGTVQVRVLDWHVDSGAWAWHDPTDITSPTCSCEVSGTDVDEDILRPPFDLIVSSDTLYDASLIDPFFATLEALCVPRYNSKNPSTPAKYPLVLLTLERRDPALITTALARAPIPLSRVPNKKLKKALERMGIRWDSADWDGVEVWRGMAQPSIHGERG